MPPGRILPKAWIYSSGGPGGRVAIDLRISSSSAAVYPGPSSDVSTSTISLESLFIPNTSFWKVSTSEVPVGFSSAGWLSRQLVAEGFVRSTRHPDRVGQHQDVGSRGEPGVVRDEGLPVGVGELGLDEDVPVEVFVGVFDVADYR